MNRQTEHGIGYTDWTWNPQTGCNHGCGYCYARPIANNIYPWKFEPHFYPDRLQEPLGLKKPSRIFVCDMGDLFGDWVEPEHIQAIIDIAHSAKRHTFQFLTKNPKRYGEFSFPKNCWLGTTVESEAQASRIQQLLSSVHVDDNIAFVSFEPLLGPIKHSIEGLDWIIIGEQTHKQHTSQEIGQVACWALDLLSEAIACGIPIFAKNKIGNIITARQLPTRKSLSQEKLS